MKKITIKSLLEESIKAQNEDIEQIKKKTPEWIAKKDKALVSILHQILESKNK